MTEAKLSEGTVSPSDTATCTVVVRSRRCPFRGRPAQMHQASTTEARSSAFTMLRTEIALVFSIVTAPTLPALGAAFILSGEMPL